jgi:hypothetical protein
MANYFSYLPNIEISERTAKSSFLDQNVIKNIYRRVSVRDDLAKYIFAYDSYTVNDGERPDSVSTKFYSTPEYDWIIIICNRYTNLYEEWPMDTASLEDYLDRKYGNKLYDVVQYETDEIQDTKQNVLIPQGTIVNANFTFTTYEGITHGLNKIRSLTNYDIEQRKNEQKKEIKVLKTQFIQKFIKEFEELIKYPESVDADNAFLKRTQIR